MSLTTNYRGTENFSKKLICKGVTLVLCALCFQDTLFSERQMVLIPAWSSRLLVISNLYTSHFCVSKPSDTHTDELISLAMIETGLQGEERVLHRAT